MSIPLPLDISEVQQIKNKKRLIHQNTMLHEEIILFEKQLNQFLVSNHQSTNPQTINQNNSHNKLVESEYSLQIEKQKKQIIKLRSQLTILKSKNIKQNIEYILKQEDDLNILKKQLYKYRKQKQIIMGFKKDKLQKLQMNNSLNQHQEILKNQLKQTIKFNRQTYSNIVQIQRDIRKYHEIADISKRIGKQKGGIISSTIYQEQNHKIIETEHQILSLKTQIKNIQQKWKNQLNSLDDEYFQLQQLFALKKQQVKECTLNDNYFKSRMSVVRSQTLIQSDKKRKQKVVISPKLKKQLQQYIKHEQEKIKNKNQTHHQISNLKQEPTVENMEDDKNLKVIKNYKNNRLKVDKNISVYEIQENRSQRTWNNGVNSTLQQSINSLQKAGGNIKKEKAIFHNVDRQIPKQIAKKNKIMPKLLLKNIGLDTNFSQN